MDGSKRDISEAGGGVGFAAPPASLEERFMKQKQAFSDSAALRMESKRTEKMGI